ncbi:sugar kinase [Microbacterium sp. R86528]|uniref:sugar kinase n=1 Tax=Microbacterium sp. R86528 TaxID=3093864 RepID=UPI0037C802F6
MNATAARIVTIGETLLLMHSLETGALERATSMGVTIGGAESNVAIGLRRLGVPVTWVSRIGDDSAGRRVLRELRSESVAVEVEIDSRRPTGLMVKEQRSANSTRVWYYRTGSAASMLTPASVPPDVIESASILHVTGITPALSTSAAETVREAISRARTAGVLVSFDVNHRERLWSADEAAPVYRDIAGDSDIVFAGVDEAQLLAPDAGSDPAALAAAIGALGPREVIIKLGADGALACEDDRVVAVPARTVAVVDTVGAGDAFVAGYLSERLAGAPLESRLHTAAATGAFACTTHGDWEGLPDRDDLRTMDATEAVTR